MEDPSAVTGSDPRPDSGSPPLATPLILRRSKPHMAYMIFLEVLLLAVIVRTAWQGSYYAIPAVAACAGVLAWTAVTLLRCRTELGPEGILNRSVRSKEFIPWQDVIRVMPVRGSNTVVIIRRDMGSVSLAGVRGPRPRTGPDLDEIIAVIQAHIDRHRPAGDEPAEPAPAVIVRRLGWGPTLPFLLTVAILSVLCAAYAFVYPPLIPVAVFFLGLSVFVCAVTVRGRTEIGPDGIRNRAFARQMFIPWADVEEVTVSETAHRTVRVMRRGGRTTTLAALRDSDVHADGLGLDDVADVVRQRAGLTGTEPAEDEPAIADARPMALRLSRRPLLWVLPLAVATAVGWVLTLGNLTFIFFYLVLAPLYLFLLAIQLLRGRTDAGPGGLRNRLLTKTTEVAWTDVSGFAIMPTLFGRVVQVIRTNGKRLTLAAPREGLLARDATMDASLETMRALAAPHGTGLPAVQSISTRGMRVFWGFLLVLAPVLSVVTWKPWVEPWWPTRHEATRLPGACALLDTGTGQRLVPDAMHRHDYSSKDRYSATSNCTLNARKADLDLNLDLRRRAGSSSGTHQAAEQFAVRKTVITGGVGGHFLGSAPVPGLGDEAWRSSSADGRTIRVELFARRHNVLVDVVYSAERPAAQVTADAERLVRTLLTRIPDSH